MEAFYRTHRYLVEHTDAPIRRGLMDEIDWEDRLIAIKGTRGVGKTTFLLQYAKERFGTDRSCLYLNMNNLYFVQHRLVDFAEKFVNDGGQVLLIDQMFKYDDWSHELRECYERFPSLKIVFTGSSVMRLKEENPELGDIVKIYYLRGLSFREFLNLQSGNSFRAYTLDEILFQPDGLCAEVNAKCRPLAYFDDYLKVGYYPFRLEGNEDYYTRIENVVNMILEIELPQQCGIDVGNIRKLKTLLTILSSEVPLMVDMTKLSALSEMSRTTLLAYLQYLHRAKLIHLLYSDLDSLKKLQKR